MKKILICIIMIFTLTGCLQRVELRDRAIAQCFGVDFENEEYTITLEFFKSSGKDEAENSDTKSQVLSSTGKTITDAVYNMNNILGKEIFLGNNNTVIIGEDTARNGIEYITGFFTGDYQTGLRTNMIVCKGKAKDFISGEDDKPVSSQNIESVIKESINQGIIPRSDIISAETVLSSEKDSAFLLGYIERSEINGKIYPEIKGGALFKNGKMTEIINKELSKGVSLVIGKAKFCCINIENDRGDKFSIIGKSPKCKVKGKIDGDKGLFKINLDFEGNVSEEMIKTDRTINVDEIKNMENICEDYVENLIEEAAKVCIMENGCDIFNFANIVKGNYDDINEFTINIKVECSLERPFAELRSRK